ncbi:flap endonuclease-1 [Candidatus Bathyarchaeota archaeon]|nr:flap endonuclease-1 [Candidatus Bathyarchaeota archaeon]MBS7628983.1 flap endonuclease-1 [Candidatus Bathyarchaeota archaeon]
MGVDLGPIVERKKISFEDLHGKSIAIDCYNALYQFLATIRGEAGEPLMDRSGRVTSHLSGLFYRTVNLMERGVWVAYVFDGEPPTVKEVELKRRMRIKEDAVIKYEEAIRRGALEEARRYAQMTSKLKDEMVEDAKRLLDSMGVPWIQAPSEGEAQAAHMVSKNDLWAVASQDYDSLLFGASRLIRNLTVTGRRKLPGREVYVDVDLELLELNKILKILGVTREQLVDLAILLGTDYNPGGFKGVGPKTALKLIREGGDLASTLKTLPAGEGLDYLSEIRKLFLHPKVTDDYKLEWRKPDIEATINFLCGERDFSERRVRNALDRLLRGWVERDRSTLEKFF